MLHAIMRELIQADQLSVDEFITLTRRLPGSICPHCRN